MAEYPTFQELTLIPKTSPFIAVGSTSQSTIDGNPPDVSPLDLV